MGPRSVCERRTTTVMGRERSMLDVWGEQEWGEDGLEVDVGVEEDGGRGMEERGMRECGEIRSACVVLPFYVTDPTRETGESPPNSRK